MINFKLAVLVCLGVLLSTKPGVAQNYWAERGESLAKQWCIDKVARNAPLLAKQWCVSCHFVDAGQTVGGDLAPPFVAIARDKTKSDRALFIWLTNPHPPMPNFNLTVWEIDAIVSYISSLR